VLFVSGYMDSASGAPVLSGPGVGRMAKPFVPIELAARVRELLDAPGIASDTDRKPKAARAASARPRTPKTD
jgi:hypothetical protein